MNAPVSRLFVHLPEIRPPPMTESALLTGILEPANEPCAIARIAGLKMAEAYRSQYSFDAISLMRTNLLRAPLRRVSLRLNPFYRLEL